VDLAGSERVSKTNIDGQILREAKHINLSLHYLEQVILALQVQWAVHSTNEYPWGPGSPPSLRRLLLYQERVQRVTVAAKFGLSKNLLFVRMIFSRAEPPYLARRIILVGIGGRGEEGKLTEGDYLRRKWGHHVRRNSIIMLIEATTLEGAEATCPNQFQFAHAAYRQPG